MKTPKIAAVFAMCIATLLSLLFAVPAAAASLKPRAIASIDSLEASGITGSGAVLSAKVTATAPAHAHFLISPNPDVSLAYTASEDHPVVSGSAFTAPVTGLSRANTYWFWISADGGTGPVISGPAVFSTANLPTTPHAPVAAPGEGRGSALISWLASDGRGMPIDSYSVVSEPLGLTCTAAAPATRCAVEGLTGTGPYTFRVSATNGVGLSGWSETSAPLDPNEKGVALSVSLPSNRSQMLVRSKPKVRVTTDGPYQGTAIVSAGNRSCSAAITGGTGTCRVRLAGRGSMSLTAGFAGDGPDAGVVGAVDKAVWVGRIALGRVVEGRCRSGLRAIRVAGEVTSRGASIKLTAAASRVLAIAAVRAHAHRWSTSFRLRPGAYSFAAESGRYRTDSASIKVRNCR